MFKRGADHRTAFKQGEGTNFFLFFALKDLTYFGFARQIDLFCGIIVTNLLKVEK
jgi:hypothetical protein